MVIFGFVIQNIGCYQGQAFDAQVVGDNLLESRLELFKMNVQDYSEAFKWCAVVKGDQGFFFCVQLLNFLHRLLQCIFARDALPEKIVWDGLLSVGFSNVQLLSVSKFLEKFEFRTKAMRAAKKCRISFEREKSNKTKTNTIASAVKRDMFNLHVDQRIGSIRYKCKGLLLRPTFKSDLVVGLACFDYSFLFTLPKSQTAGCFSRFFESFCVHGWLSREFKKIHLDNNLVIFDVLQLDELYIGPKIEVMVTFLSSSLELSKREYTSFIFKLLCLWLGPELPLCQSYRKFHWVRLMGTPSKLICQMLWDVTKLSIEQQSGSK